MDRDELRAQARQARQISVPLDDAAGIAVTITLPTRYEMQLCLLEAAGVGQHIDAAAKLRYRRLELLRAVAGWAGIRERHVLAAGSDAPLPFDAGLVDLLLDAQPAWEDTIGSALLDELAKRNKLRDTAEKN